MRATDERRQTKGDRVIRLARELISDGLDTFTAIESAAREYASSDADEVALRNETHAIILGDDPEDNPQGGWATDNATRLDTARTDQDDLLSAIDNVLDIMRMHHKGEAPGDADACENPDNCGHCLAMRRIRAALDGPWLAERARLEDTARAATALLLRLERITTTEFSHGGEGPERRALRAHLEGLGMVVRETY